MCGNPAETISGLCGRCGALQTLGLTFMATAPEIENTYRTLVKVWHPDRFQADVRLQQAAEEKLKEINAAHEYLVSGPKITEPPVQPPPPPRREVRQDAEFVAAVQQPQPEPPEPLEESPEVLKILRRQKQRRWNAPRTVISSLFTLGGIVGFALLWFALDAFMSANASTSIKWEQMKAGVAHDIQANFAQIWPGSSHKETQAEPSQDAAPAAATAVPPAEAASSADAKPKQPAHQQHRPATEVAAVKQNEPKAAALPYVTTGLTPMEVLSALGKPSSSAGEKMFYNGSEIDFQNGHVAGWKISAAAPIRVKLWPDTPPTPGITTFTVGSSKSDVIAVQGTPNLLAQNEFGYGNSIVYFQSGRVVSWKEDPASVRLKVAH